MKLHADGRQRSGAQRRAAPDARSAPRLFITALPTDMEVSLISTAPAPRSIYKAGTDRVKLLRSHRPDHARQRRAEVHRRAVGSRRSRRQGQDRQEQGKGQLLPRLHDGRQQRRSKAATPRDYQVTKLFKQTSATAPSTVHIVMQQQLQPLEPTSRTRHEPDRGRAQAHADDRRPLRGDQHAKRGSRRCCPNTPSRSRRATCGSRISTESPVSRPAAPRRSRSRRRRCGRGMSAALTLDGRVP